MLKTNEFIKSQVNETLIEVKTLIDNNSFEFQATSKNIETYRNLRRELGITYDDFKDEIIDRIKTLSIENYSQGPELDNNPERDLIFWIFGIFIFNREIYLKFDIREENGKKAVFWSYHIPEYSMIYPFKV